MKLYPLTVYRMPNVELFGLISSMKPGWFPEDVRKKTREIHLQEPPEGAIFLGDVPESQRVVLYLNTAMWMGMRARLIEICGAEDNPSVDEILGYIELMLPEQKREFNFLTAKQRTYRHLSRGFLGQMLNESFGMQVPYGYAPIVCRRFRAFSVEACDCCGLPNILHEEEDLLDSEFLAFSALSSQPGH